MTLRAELVVCTLLLICSSAFAADTSGGSASRSASDASAAATAADAVTPDRPSTASRTAAMLSQKAGFKSKAASRAMFTLQAAAAVMPPTAQKL